MSDALQPLSSLPPPSFRQRVWQAKRMILLGVILLAIICIKAYWKSDIHSYLADHPLVWQKGLIILGVAALALVGAIKYRNRTQTPAAEIPPPLPSPLLREPPLSPHDAVFLPLPDHNPLLHDQRVYINERGERVVLNGGWRRRQEQTRVLFRNILTGEEREIPPPIEYMQVSRTAQPAEGEPLVYIDPGLERLVLPEGWRLVAYTYASGAYYFSHSATNTFKWIIPARDLNNDEAELLAWVALEAH